MSDELGPWDNLQVGHIPNEDKHLQSVRGVIEASTISGMNVDEVNLIKKNLYNRKKL